MTTTNTGWTSNSILETLNNPAAADDIVERSTWATVDMTTALTLEPIEPKYLRYGVAPLSLTPDFWDRWISGRSQHANATAVSG